MARPQPRIIMSEGNEEVCEAGGVYAVLYRGEPFVLRNLPSAKAHYKYQTTVYCNPGNALRLCKTLNQRYDTESFTVERLVSL